ncbi:SGNH/GDSL hydrolase family protein [Acinetobacter rudis]|uniref:Uncharacterized protein n=1 Tax=Acinetobacter rudis CIP 110305 TaxID=421052 RepID=S3MVZ4_9GAMM|nr:SGNH/GDSL hydrolase family protein [Acinetobacter rudis]EPF71950.1 hypothetical protein F945_02296 [Acinetobacter rudis CIP 110305]
MPNAIRQIMENGGFMPFATEAELLAYVPNISPSAAKAMDTKKVWLWKDNGWYDTGLSELDQAISRVQQQVPKLESSSENIFTVTDANGLETWIGADQDGELTTKALSSIQKAQSFSSQKYGGLMFTDENGVLYDLALNPDGTFSNHTKESLSTNDSMSENDFYFDSDNQLKKIKSVKHKSIILGSSTLWLMQANMSSMLNSDFKFSDIYQGGVSGESIEQIANRFGAIPVKIKFDGDKIIPGQNFISVDFDGLTTLVSAKSTRPVIGHIAVGGRMVSGTFSYNTTENKFMFTSQSADEIYAANQYEFISNFTSYSDSDLLILNAGKNNVGQNNEHGTAAYINDSTLRIFKHMQPLAKHIIVASHFSNTTSNDAVLKIVNDVNAQYEKQYGALYFDMNAYLMSPEVWSDTGITPNEIDLQKQKEGRLPLSLARDTGSHLNDVTNAAVIQKLKQFILEKGWY